MKKKETVNIANQVAMQYAPLGRLEDLERNLGYLQHQVDELSGADPVHCKSKERTKWKNSMTERLQKVRKNHPDQAVRNRIKILFGRVYQTMSRKYGIDLNAEKKAYMERNGIPERAFYNVRMLNVMWQNEDLREKFEAEVAQFETWYPSTRPEFSVESKND